MRSNVVRQNDDHEEKTFTHLSPMATQGHFNLLIRNSILTEAKRDGMPPEYMDAGCRTGKTPGRLMGQ